MLSPNNEKKCSVVIPTKNGGALFKKMLHAIQQQSIFSQIELIVVDSGSTDGTLNSAREAGALVIEIPPQDFNHGASRDLGISRSNCEVVILMVQDAVPNDLTLLETMVARFDDNKIAGVYVRQIPQPDADLLTKRNLNNWLTGRNESEIRRIKSLEWYVSLSPTEKYYFCNFDNVCSALRKSVWQNHRFGLVSFGEDIDWAERVLKANYKIVYEPAVAVIHSHSRSILYEYKRIYVCHRKLYCQFGLHTVPTLRGAAKSYLFATVQDLKYALRHSVILSEKLALVAKVPILNFLSALAQYRAVRDEVRGKANTVMGI